MNHLLSASDLDSLSRVFEQNLNPNTLSINCRKRLWMVLLHSRIDQGACVVRLPKIAMQSAVADNVVAFVTILVATPNNRGVPP
jgi:hypothetical protein